MNIQEDFVSFEIAELLKEKGFNEPCYTCYVVNEISHYDYCLTNFEAIEEVVTAPTLQMACRWLTAVHNLFITFELDFSDGAYPLFDAVVYNLATCKKYPIINYDRYSYIKGIEAAIKYCLENLI
jgi:hypothetical protein